MSEPESEFRAVNDFLHDVAWLPKSQRLLVSSQNEQMLRFWDMKTQRMLLNLPGTGYRTTICFSEDETTIAVRNRDGEIHVWKAPPGKNYGHSIEDD